MVLMHAVVPADVEQERDADLNRFNLVMFMNYEIEVGDLWAALGKHVYWVVVSRVADLELPAEDGVEDEVLDTLVVLSFGVYEFVVAIPNGFFGDQPML